MQVRERNEEGMAHASRDYAARHLLLDSTRKRTENARKRLKETARSLLAL